MYAQYDNVDALDVVRRGRCICHSGVGHKLSYFTSLSSQRAQASQGAQSSGGTLLPRSLLAHGCDVWEGQSPFDWISTCLHQSA